MKGPGEIAPFVAAGAGFRAGAGETTRREIPPNQTIDKPSGRYQSVRQTYERTSGECIVCGRCGGFSVWQGGDGDAEIAAKSND